LRETDGTKQGGDCSYGRKMTCQHEFHPSGGESCGAIGTSYGLSRAKAIAQSRIERDGDVVKPSVRIRPIPDTPRKAALMLHAQ